MFKTSVGALADMSSVAYLRPETAQGIFTNFANVQRTARMKVRVCVCVWVGVGVCMCKSEMLTNLTPFIMHHPLKH
jgi:hypothetical protein